MALIKCPECGNNISDKSNNCIHCGFPIVADLSYSNTSDDCVEKNKDKVNNLENRKVEVIKTKKVIIIFLVISLVFIATKTYISKNILESLSYLSATILVHLCPILIYRFLCRKRPLTKKYAVILSTVDGIIVFFFEVFVIVSTEGVFPNANVTPYILWSYICYLFLISKSKNDVECKIFQEDKPKKSLGYKISIALSILFFITTIGVSIFSSILLSSLKDEMSIKQERIEELETLVIKLNDGLEKKMIAEDNMENALSQIGFIGSSDEEHYHKWDCKYFKGNTFMAHNTGYAESLNIRPCPFCW